METIIVNGVEITRDGKGEIRFTNVHGNAVRANSNQDLGALFDRLKAGAAK